MQIFPLNLSPSALGQNYSTEFTPITAIGGTAPYTWAITAGALPVGLALDPATGQISGRPLVADAYANSNAGGPPLTLGPAFSPVIQNPSTFTLTATDSLSATGSISYTIPVGVLSEDEAISVFEMLGAAYGSDWYIVLADMGTRTIRIGDIGNAAFGGVRLAINAYLNSSTQGQLRRLREYICEFDKIKLIVQEQVNGSVDGITGINNSFQKKKQALLFLVKSVLPAYSRAEVESRQQHKGGSDFTGNITGSGSGAGTFVSLQR